MQFRGSQSGQKRPLLPDSKMCGRKHRGDCEMPREEGLRITFESLPKRNKSLEYIVAQKELDMCHGRWLELIKVLLGRIKLCQERMVNEGRESMTGEENNTEKDDKGIMMHSYSMIGTNEDRDCLKNSDLLYLLRNLRGGKYELCTSSYQEPEETMSYSKSAIDYKDYNNDSVSNEIMTTEVLYQGCMHTCSRTRKRTLNKAEEELVVVRREVFEEEKKVEEEEKVEEPALVEMGDQAENPKDLMD
ncbi:hypothetical protein AgCh_018304 [Apium graveolens]